MISDSIIRIPRPQDVAAMGTPQLRDNFVVSNLFTPGQLNARFTDLDRLVVGGVMPVTKPVELPNHKETG
ncbi:MAG TPA: 5-dehydro-4-deoxy-D-glucuronate isomerase, partial [Verrucomicrobiae bacterium]